jgi:diguanylate cyclase (GGDEF)-like protein
MLDLDHFKQINDTYGHAAGDEVLQRIVAVCRQELRDSDLFGRMGGEEFGILMPGCTCEQGVEIATRIRRALASALLKLGPETSVVVSASLGLAHSAASGYAFHQLFSDADAALYRAKHGGRNRLVVDIGGDAPVVADADTRDTASA